MKHSKLVILGAVLGIAFGGLVGCSKEDMAARERERTEQLENRSQVNQCIRAELFKQCVSTLPAGPVATKYNDWSEVVEECGDQARNMSWRITRTIPLECRTEVPRD